MKPTGVYWGLRETGYAGTLSSGARSEPVSLELRFKDEQIATFEVQPKGERPFTIEFTWTWHEDKNEAWISVVRVHVRGHAIAAQSVGALQDGALKFTVTGEDIIEAFAGNASKSFEIDAREAT